MQQLHLVGFTTDHRGLIFSVRRGAKSGRFMIQLDDRVMTAVEELRALLAEEAAAEADAKTGASRPESALSVREVQARLRRGRTIEQVAREAGVDAGWIARFAVPVIAEQSEVIRAARGTRMTKQRVGLSGANLGDAVYRNLAERGVTDPRDELDKRWRARQLTEGMWLVTFTYTARGRDFEASWEYDETSSTLRARGRLGTQLGFREGRRPSTATRTRSATKKIAKKTSGARAKKSSPPTTARRSSSRQATKRVAAARRAAAARMVSEAEKATRRNAALARKAAKRPVVIPPRAVDTRSPDSEPEPLLVDEPDAEHAEPVEPIEPIETVEAPTRWSDELVLDWDERPGDLEDGDDLEFEQDDDLEVGPALEPARRREPLRAPSRAQDGDESPAERARRRVRVRAATSDDDPEQSGNGPVFRSDLAQPASSAVDRQSFPLSTAGQSPQTQAQPPLSMPLRPIEPPPRRRRMRPLRGR